MAVEALPSRQLARSVAALRELDNLLDGLMDYIDPNCLPDLDEKAGPVRVLCAYAEEMHDEWRECQARFGMSPEMLRLRISEILVNDMAPEAEEALQQVAGPTTLQDVAEAWTRILWRRTMRFVDEDGTVHKHF